MTIIHPALHHNLSVCLGTNSFQFENIGGGSINKAFKLVTPKGTFFCKVNSATKFPHLFQKEALGLSLIEQQRAIKTPQVVDLLENDSDQVLLLEWIAPSSPAPTFWKDFGEQLAALHAATHIHFGLDTDNYMGAVPQHNTPATVWSNFFIHQRLEPLVQQCHTRHLLTAHHVSKFQKLYPLIAAIFNEEPPALLHGDLWSGNFMCTLDQQPVLIDPAVYYGHRSIDLGMTTLFGGFDKAFYEAYHYHFPLPTNYREQWAVSNLYPLLIHLLLFGKSYLHSIERTLNDFQ